MQPKAVTFDVGGIIYSDDVFKEAIFQALEHFNNGADRNKFEAVYEEHLKSHSGSLRTKLCMAFFGNLELKGEIMKYATERWNFTTVDLYQDAIACIDAIKATGAKIGLVANQPLASIDSLKRDGIFEKIDFVGISAKVGLEKPDPAFFQLALKELGTDAKDAIHIGNRFDTDVLPAKNLGMRTVWVLRGEANPEPAQSDIDQADIVVSDLTNVAELIAKLS
jgi:putative hydrolase of the HAD superfamily